MQHLNAVKSKSVRILSLLGLNSINSAKNSGSPEFSLTERPTLVSTAPKSFAIEENHIANSSRSLVSKDEPQLTEENGNFILHQTDPLKMTVEELTTQAATEDEQEEQAELKKLEEARASEEAAYPSSIRGRGEAQLRRWLLSRGYAETMVDTIIRRSKRAGIYTGRFFGIFVCPAVAGAGLGYVYARSAARIQGRMQDGDIVIPASLPQFIASATFQLVNTCSAIAERGLYFLGTPWSEKASDHLYIFFRALSIFSMTHSFAGGIKSIPGITVNYTTADQIAITAVASALGIIQCAYPYLKKHRALKNKNSRESCFKCSTTASQHQSTPTKKQLVLKIIFEKIIPLIHLGGICPQVYDYFQTVVNNRVEFYYNKDISFELFTVIISFFSLSAVSIFLPEGKIITPIKKGFFYLSDFSMWCSINTFFFGLILFWAQNDLVGWTPEENILITSIFWLIALENVRAYSVYNQQNNPGIRSMLYSRHPKSKLLPKEILAQPQAETTPTPGV